MRQCPSDKTLSRYLDGELPDTADGRVRAHLAGCARCRERHERLLAVDRAMQQEPAATPQTPDLAGRVRADLARRGAFFRARVAAGKRRLFGEGLRSWRMLAAVGAAVGIVMLATAGMDYLTRRQWVRETEPVLADAERVLVRLVYVETPVPSGERLRWARTQARKLDLANRLERARAKAEPAWAKDLAPLENTFALLTANRPLPAEAAHRLTDGELLGRATRLRETLARGG